MSVKHIIKTNKLPEVYTKLKGLKNKKIKIGVPEGESAWLAGIHEYG